MLSSQLNRKWFLCPFHKLIIKASCEAQHDEAIIPHLIQRDIRCNADRNQPSSLQFIPITQSRKTQISFVISPSILG